MTHPNYVTNGASLEDCHTNFFALTDLCGIKWRRLWASSVFCVDPLDDPVLSSYSKCLAANILCVWRRVISRGHEQQHSSLHETNQLSFNKELWIFWYGEEPELTGLISPELTADGEQGSWESGLSYECRSLLFKALHNLIERCLLSRGITRLGKWFVQPYDGLDKPGRSPQFTFAFNFFVHGESTVCASVDVRQHPAVYCLTKHHLLAAQSSHSGIKVILCPFGMAGTLTGQSYKDTDMTTRRLLSEWHQFYPLPSRDHNNRELGSEDDDMPCAVEVIVGGVKMRYPSCYVFFIESDDLSQDRILSGMNNSQTYVPLTPGISTVPSQSSHKTMGVLTPPTSPCDPSGLSHQSHRFNSQSSTVVLSDTFQQCYQPQISVQQHSKTSYKTKQAVWQDSTVNHCHNSVVQSEGISEENVGQWDFCDPASQARCTCSRSKKNQSSSQALFKVDLNSNTSSATFSGSSAGTITNSHRNNSSSTNNSINTASKNDKLEKERNLQRIRGLMPFHKRNLSSETVSAIDYDSYVTPTVPNITSNFSTNTTVLVSSGPATNQYKTLGINSSIRAATPTGLPQLQNSFTQPSSVGSPHPATPIPDGSSSHITSSDPAMPTLSPHPPPVKEEEGLRLESQEPPVATTSPSSIQDSNSNGKAKCHPEQSPLTSLLDASKASDNSPSLSSNQWTPVTQSEDTKAGISTSTQSSAIQNVTTQATTLPLGLKRPLLPTITYDDPDEQFRSGLLYDYTNLNGSLWDIAPSKRRRVIPSTISRKNNNDLSSSSYYPSPYNREGQSQTQDADPLPIIPKDPYEFNDEFDEESPTSVFRNRVDVFIKEEEKPKDSVMPPTPEAQAPPPTTQDIPKQTFIPEQLSVASPSTPRNQVSSFTREQDLQVTDRDLEQIFDTSSSDDNDDMFPPPSTPSSTKMANTPEEPFSGKSNKNNSCTGILGTAELTRMFPTPPSLEHNAAPSPSGPLGGTDMTVLESADSFAFRERSDIYPDTYGSPSIEPVKDWSYVFKPAVQQKFVGSKRYAPILILPSSHLSPISLSSECIYKVSWQHPLTTTVSTGICGPGSLTAPTDRHSNPVFVDHMKAVCRNEGQISTAWMLKCKRNQYQPIQTPENERMIFPVESTLDQRNLSTNYDLQSPASSASSYLNKHLNSIDNSSTISAIPEAHSLLVNLVLSDSMLNLFKDHNFASCTLCVCNMNIKGADFGIYLPSSLVPSGTDEPQYKCTCGFSAVVNRNLSHFSGLFYEDEVEITGIHYEAINRRRRSLSIIESTVKRNICIEGGRNVETRSTVNENKESVGQVDQLPCTIIDLMTVQCSTLYSTCSLFFKAVQLHATERIHPQYNALEMSDGCEICFLGLDTGKQAMDNINTNKLDENLKSTCLHKWPYLPVRLPVSSHDTVHLLRLLQPLLQEAIQKKRTSGLWELTYTVAGPLTWRQFHRLAGRGTEDQCEPQPIPSLLVGYDKDWLALSPFAVKFWDKLLLEPYSMTRDVAYIVVAPDNDFILGHVKTFFKELSNIYELCKLGRHCPITKVLRDGIMRVGKIAAKKLADEPVDEWFNQIGDGPVASKLKLYAQVCRHHLAPHLATQPLDRTLLDNCPPPMKPPEKPIAPTVASPMPPSTPENQEKDRASTPKPADSENTHDSTATGSNINQNTGTTANNSGSSQDPWDGEDEQQPPALIIYIVEPFTYGSLDNDLYRLSTIGLLRCYAQMLRFLPEQIQNSIHLQLVTLDSVMWLGKDENGSKRQEQLKALAFTVFSQCRRLLTHNSTVKSLTGFGPAASQDIFLRGRNERNSGPQRMFSLPFILAPLKDKQTELGEMFGDRREKSHILYCIYCLTEDQRYLLATCTNDKGDMLETCCINIEIPNRTRRKKASARKIGLHKLLQFILEVLSTSVQPWRLVIGRLGRLGHGELREWASLLGRKSLLCYSRQLRDLCQQCAVLGPIDTPSILSACLISLEPDSALRIMPDQFTPDDRFSSSCNSCDLSTPEDATCTHILVFPTSATTQSSQATFQQEHIDPLSTTLGDEDILQALNEDDITHDINDITHDIFRWTESPTQSPGNSPHRDSISQPGSPSGVVGGRHSPFQSGGPNRGLGGMNVESQEEPLLLLQQPLALGYYVSTAKTGPLPKWFWSSCPHLEDVCPVFLKSALLIHSPSVQQSSDDLLHSNPHIRNYHPLDSNLTTDVLRYVLEGYNALSWLSLDSTTHDRRSCLPVHIQVLTQLYHAVEALV